MDPFVVLTLILLVSTIFFGVTSMLAAIDRDFYRDCWNETSERHGQLFHRLSVQTAEHWETAREALEADADLRRIKIAIWGTAEIDRNAQDIVKLIADWRQDINASAARIAELEVALRDANAICQTAHAVANRMGRETKWGRFAAEIEESLERQASALEGTAPSVPTSLNSQPSTLN